jgi:broad-specificity NMP kinase
MFNVCSGCGIYLVEKIIEKDGPFAVCPKCGSKHRFVQLPLFVITGASGTGKTVVTLELTKMTSRYVFIEGDIFWNPYFNNPDENYKSFRDHCLRVAKNISQSGRPVVLSGTAVPEGYVNSPESRYFSDIHYLALICDDEALEYRLKSRPLWRNSYQPDFIDSMKSFNQWIRSNAHKTKPPMTILDNTSISVEETSKRVLEWLYKKDGDHNAQK